ncbi:phosphotriesterase family protein [Actinomadura fibrosa]|uniref:Aryldialkylphosphatase n=1 Tax=Actinomadura fibrosa TaxID=111802 RepID=A0ABW2Y2T2_9ACTN|nr:aryldialkylphosphatase [Actinomadura fibrosa]
MTPREETGRLRTVTGTIATSDITGPVLSHEHLQLDLRWSGRPAMVDSDPYRWLDDEKAVIKELSRLRAERGLGLVVDLTCSGMGRNAAALARISAGARVAVIAGTGTFTEPFHGSAVREALAGAPGTASAVERIAERLLAETGFGLDGTNALPGVIGEIGAWGDAPTEAEELCLRAAARASRYCGLSVATYGRAGLAQLEILTAAGLAPDRVAVGQQDLVDDPGQHRKIAETGAYVSFGSSVLAGEDHAAIGARVRGVMDLLEAGHGDRVLLSSGVSRMAQIVRNGGGGFGHLFDTLLPALRAAGADDATLDGILRDNPLRWLTAAAA